MCDVNGHQHNAPSLEIGEPYAQQVQVESGLTGILPHKASRKRKRNASEEQYQIGKPFTIQAHQSLPSTNTQELVPQQLIPRSCLPLAYLDSTGDSEGRAGTRIFATRIDLLETIASDSWQSNQPMVLIAKSTHEDRLYAVEKVQKGFYALCKLGRWVTLAMTERLHNINSAHFCHPQASSPDHLSLSSENWWREAVTSPAIRMRGQICNTAEDRGKRAPRLSLHKPAQKQSPPSPPIGKPSHDPVANWTEAASNATLDNPMPGPEQIPPLVRSQYQEALYASKTSLAYFAKGPLSRARAAFQSSGGSSFDISPYIQFLRSNILSLATLDTKYRDTVPNLVRELPFTLPSDDESTCLLNTVSDKARKSSKLKIGKNGLCPGEEISVARWWLSREIPDAGNGFGDAREENTRASLAKQRARETQLQIILVLEILSLEAPVAVPLAPKAPPADTPEKVDESQLRKKKPKKPQDLNVMLDLFVDRLCIWQSMDVDGTKTENENKTTSQLVAKAATSTVVTDQLRQFCVDVLLPFYSARLPDLTASICQKLGVLKQPSPRRPPLAKAATSYAPRKPGTILQRQGLQRPRRTLERVLTDERSASQKPPSLSRSITEPVLPHLKRETSETSLSSIPLNRVALHKRYSQREVDLYAASKATEAKVKKKAMVEQELQIAIAALKKPNPRMAVKEFVEDAEKRVAGTHPRKPKNPTRKVSAQGVQVTATPSRNRQVDVFANIPRLPRPSLAAAATSTSDLDRCLPPDISGITDSTQKVRKRSTVGPTIEQTPRRGSSKFVDQQQLLATTDKPLAGNLGLSTITESSNRSSCIVEQRNSNTLPPSSSEIHETPSKPRSVYVNTRWGTNEIEATPMKDFSTMRSSAGNLHTATHPPTSQDNDLSIYTALKWDDDVDELS